MQRRHRRAHRYIWLCLAIIIPLLLLFSQMERVTGTMEEPAVPLDERAKAIGEKAG